MPPQPPRRSDAAMPPRGTQNAGVRYKTTADTFTDRAGDRTLQAFLRGDVADSNNKQRFASEEMEAFAEEEENRFRRSQAQQMYEEAEAEDFAAAQQEQMLQLTQRKAAHIRQQTKKIRGLGKKAAQRGGLYWQFFIAFWLWIFQIFLSIMGLAVMYIVDTVKGNMVTNAALKLIEIVANAVAATASFLGIDFVQEVYDIFKEGDTFLVNLSLFIAIVSFAFYYAWLRVTGINPTDSVTGIFVTILCLCLYMLPGFNVIPWLMVWLVYAHSQEVFKM